MREGRWREGEEIRERREGRWRERREGEGKNLGREDGRCEKFCRNTKISIHIHSYFTERINSATIHNSITFRRHAEEKKGKEEEERKARSLSIHIRSLPRRKEERAEK